MVTTLVYVLTIGCARRHLSAELGVPHGTPVGANACS